MTACLISVVIIFLTPFRRSLADVLTTTNELTQAPSRPACIIAQEAWNAIRRSPSFCKLSPHTATGLVIAGQGMLSVAQPTLSASPGLQSR
jgi:hypothetical protein